MDYLLKANAIIILFYLCYKLFLQGETFFESNRYFLLTGLAIASIIPFVVIPIYVTAAPILNEFNFITPVNRIQPVVEESFNFLQLFTWIYLLGIVLFTIKFLIEFTGLIIILIQNKRIKKGQYTYVETKRNHSPFSFFKYIVYNPNHFNVTELEHIILHETVHAKQYHSIDILITKITAILFWFNPFVWLYNKSLQQNLEFIADNNTQQKITDTKSYQTLLLKTVLSTKQMTLVNNFYNSLIKKRIIMLHKSKSKQLNVWKYTLILPLLALFLMSFNTKEVYITEAAETNNSTPVNKPVETINVIDAIEAVIITKNSSKQDLENAKKEFSKLDVNLKFKGIKRNKKGEIIAIKASFKTPEGNKGNYNVSKTKSISAFKFHYNSNTGEAGFSKINDNTFIVKGEPNENVFILSNDDDEEEEKTTYRVKKKKNNGNEDVEVIVKKKSGIGVLNFNTDIGPKDYKLKKNSNKNNVYTYSTDENNKNVGLMVKGKPNKTTYFFHTDDNKEGQEVEVIVKGNNVVNGTAVVKGTETKIINGTKVISTWTEDKDNNNEGKSYIIDLNKENSEIILRNSDNSKTPIFIKDGEIISSTDLNGINPNKVASINILKGDTATSLYGANAKDGAVIITTKVKAGGTIINKENIVLIKDGKEISLEDIKKENQANATENYLYVLDGKEISKTELEKVYSLEFVESMNVLKGKKAIKKYGEKGKNGVVEITSKK